MTKNGNQRYRRLIEKGKVTEKLEGQKPIEEKYTEWTEEIKRIKIKCEAKVKGRKDENKTIKNLMRAKRRIKKEKRITKINQTRRKLIN